MKIAVYAIALNEAAFAERFMASCREADLVLVADTGSTDRTAELLASLGAEVRAIRIQPWRFDAARNAALALVPEDVDVCIALDLDQTLEAGWRPLLEAAWRSNVDMLGYTHVFAPADARGPTVFLDNRIHARHGFVWRYPCHECLARPDRAPSLAHEPRLRVLHQPDPAKSRANYLPLLQLGADERPDDSRCAYYLGRELGFLGRHAEAAAEFERCLALPSGDLLERSAVMRRLAHAREALGDGEGALALFQTAVREPPAPRGAMVELAWAYHRRQAWAPALEAARAAMAMPEGLPLYGEETAAGVIVEDIACLAAWALGRPQDALAYARAALAKAPASLRLQANLSRIEAAIAQGGRQAFGVSMTPLTESASGST